MSSSPRSTSSTRAAARGRSPRPSPTGRVPRAILACSHWTTGPRPAQRLPSRSLGTTPATRRSLTHRSSCWRPRRTCPPCCRQAPRSWRPRSPSQSAARAPPRWRSRGFACQRKRVACRTSPTPGAATSRSLRRRPSRRASKRWQWPSVATWRAISAAPSRPWTHLCPFRPWRRRRAPQVFGYRCPRSRTRVPTPPPDGRTDGCLSRAAKGRASAPSSRSRPITSRSGRHQSTPCSTRAPRR
mmetsp:Transcript_13340/g.55877  ORF Transcript_13340/g.55877 Transcript_13340/m.55877 type:complete len:242 (-) Transcript_13340:570-1295(-)